MEANGNLDMGQTCKKSGTWEPSSRTFFRNQSFKDIKLKNYSGIDKIGARLTPISLYLYLTH